MPGALLIDSRSTRASEVSSCLRGLASGMGRLCKKTSADGAHSAAIALDAGACWIAIPDAGDEGRRGAMVFIRKDGEARGLDIAGVTYYPQDQETRWPVSELEAASSALWIAFLSVASALSVDLEDDPFSLSAKGELISQMERGALSEQTQAAGAAKRKPGL